jgi:hypothetical protein
MIGLHRPWSACGSAAEIGGASPTTEYAVLAGQVFSSGTKTTSCCVQEIEIGLSEVYDHSTSLLIPRSSNPSLYEGTVGWRAYRTKAVSAAAGGVSVTQGTEGSGLSQGDFTYSDGNTYGYVNSVLSATTVTEGPLLASGVWDMRYPLVIQFEPEIWLHSPVHATNGDTIECIGIKFDRALTDYTSGPYWYFGTVNVVGWILRL